MKKVIAFFVSALFFFSFSALAANKTEKEFKTADDCIKTESGFVFSTKQKARCAELIDSFSEEIEMVDSGPLGICRLLSGGKARLKSAPMVLLPRGMVIAVSERVGSSGVHYNLKNTDTSCQTWRVWVADIEVVSPRFKKQE